MTTRSKSPFEALRELQVSGKLAPTPPSRPSAPTPPTSPARAVVRMERKGRGGKEATVIEQLGLSLSELDTWCRELKRSLGCGGTVDKTTIVLQGDLRQRVATWLTERGVRKVVIG